MTVSVQYVLVTPPDNEPISLGSLKEYLQIPEDVGANDTLVTRMGVAARESIETVLRRQIVTATWLCYYDAFPGQLVMDATTAGERSLSLNSQRPQKWLDIPKPPLQSVTLVEYRDPTSEQWVTLDSSKYVVRTETEPGRIELAYQEQWPEVLAQLGSVRITFVAGYGDDEETVPATITTAICALTKHLYDMPNPVITSGAQPVVMPLHLEYLLSSVRWHGWE